MESCQICNKEFKKRRGKKANRFCSLPCYWKNMKGTYPKKLIPYKGSTAGWGKGKKRPEISRENNPKWNGIPFIKKCFFCQKTFERNFTRQKYCSMRCRNIAKLGKKFNTEHKEKIRQAGKRIFSNKEYREKRLELMLKALLKRPTSLEKKMMEIIQKHHLPYKYTGDGSFWIGYPPKNPDFVNVNGEKKLIEVGNEYHHRGDYIKNRSTHFSKYGWQSFIFIGNKLNENEILTSLSIKGRE